MIGNTIAILILASGVAVWVHNVMRLAARRPFLPYQPRPEIRWNPLLLIVAGGYVLLLLVGNLEAQIGRISDPDSTPNEVTLHKIRSGCLIGTASLAVFLLLLSEAGRRTLAQFGITTRNWKRNCVTGVAGFLAAFPLVYGVALLVRLIYNDPSTQHPFLRLLKSNGTTETIAWITVAVVVLAPLSEELIFRVILQGALRSRLPALASIAISSVLFVLVHGFPDMLALLPLAIVFGYVYERTHSYLAVVTMHATFNGVMLSLKLLS